MSITIIDKPNDVDFCGNPLAFKVSGSNYIISSGSKANLGINWASADSNSQGFNLAFLDYLLEFRCATTPDDSGLQYPPKGSETLIEWKQIVTAVLASNFYLAKYFDVSYNASQDIVQAQAKEEGPTYNIIFTNISGNSTEDSNVSGTDRSVQLNYRILAQLFIENEYASGSFESLSDMLCDPDEEGNATIYINKKLQSYFKEVDLPVFNQATITKCEHTIKKYYLKFAERYGSTPVLKKLYSSETLQVIDGKIPFNKYPAYNIFSDILSGKKYLSNRVSKIETWIEAQQYLYFFNYLNDTFNIKARCTVYYTDGLSTAVDILTYDDLAFKEVVLIPTGGEQLGLSNSANIYKYEVSVWATSGVYSGLQIGRTITYSIINKPLFARQFIFQNKRGVLETLLTTGRQKNTFKVEKAVSTKSLQYNYDIKDGHKHSKTTLAENLFEVSSGFKLKEEAILLKEMLENNHFYLVGKSDFIRCQIQKGSFKIVDENEDLFTVSFTYSTSFEGNWVDEFEEIAVPAVDSYGDSYADDYN